MKIKKLNENSNDNKFLDFIEKQTEIFNLVKIYLTEIKPEFNTTKLNILIITKVEYFNYSKVVKIGFKDHRRQHDWYIDLNKIQSEDMIEFINDQNIYRETRKYNL